MNKIKFYITILTLLVTWDCNLIKIFIFYTIFFGTKILHFDLI